MLVFRYLLPGETAPMPLRPLALAALLLLSPAPVAAHAAETEPAPAPTAESPAEDPSPEHPAAGGEDGKTEPLPETGPADSPTSAPDSAGSTLPDAGSTPPDEPLPPAPEGPVAPEPDEFRWTAAPGTSPERSADAAQLPALEHTSFVEPATVAAPRPGSGALLRQEPALRGQVLSGQQVAPGTLTRISLGTVTRVPVQDAAAGSSGTDWIVGLSAVGTAAAAVVALRSRSRRTGS